VLPTVTDDPGDGSGGPPPGSPSGATAAGSAPAALARHNAAMRRRSRIYALVLAVVVVLGAVVVARLWAVGEVHNTRSAPIPSGSVPAAIAPTPASTRLVKAWDTGDTAALGTPVFNGTVVTSDDHTVRGRDARDGTQTWSYYRSNRAVCSVAQANGVTMALYRVNGNCDELTALDTGTGRRKWTRTLDMDAHPLNGTPLVSVTPYTLMLATPDVIYALDPGSGYDRWEFHPAGCRIQRAVIGSTGALISQVCDAPQCAGVRYCGAGPQLLLRDPYAGHDDKNSALDKNGDNPDQLLWNRIGDTDIPVSADSVVSALNRTTRALDVLDAHSGAPSTQVRLVPTPQRLGGIVTTPTSAGELVWISGVTYALGTDDKPAWTLTSSGPPTVLGATSTEWPAQAATARVTLTAAGGTVLTVDAVTGRTTRRSRGASTTPGGTAQPLGSGFLVVNEGGCVAYR
jgi:hypothetical protein